MHSDESIPQPPTGGSTGLGGKPKQLAAAGTAPPGSAPLEPMDPQLTTIQPGGGFIMQLELAWGKLRRGYLRRFRRGYLARMDSLRRGENNGCPHEVLDPRDCKYFRNQRGSFWRPEDDPFTWRDRLPFARDGLAELILIGGGAFAAGLALLLLGLFAAAPWSWVLLAASAGFAVMGGLIVWFFRDPEREIPPGEGTVVSPADGRVVAVEDIEDDEVGGPAVLIGIFLSIFDVHVNRSPVAGRVLALRYRPGKCLNALRPESARENEQLAIRMQTDDPARRLVIVRQITGAIARRIVCRLQPGDELASGERFGMIKLGSRAEIVLPRESGLELQVRCGEKVRAGSSVLAAYRHAKPNAGEDS